MNKPNKVMISLQLTPEAKSLLEALADKQGISQSAVIEILIRHEEKRVSSKDKAAAEKSEGVI